MLKICHVCDSIMGEVELEDNLTDYYSDSIMDVVGNVAYALCPDCIQDMEIEDVRVLH